MPPTDRREFLRHATGGLAAAAFLTPDGRAAHRPPFRPREPLSVAVVGSGAQGRAILAELAKIEDVSVAAIADPESRRLRRGVRRTRSAKGYEDIPSLLAGAPEAKTVFLATPTHLHKEHVEVLLEAGRHVYCEAPMAASLEDARAIAEMARDADTLVQVGHQARSNPVYGLARSFYRSGSIADLLHLDASWRQKTTWKTPVNDPERSRRLNWRLYHDTSPGLIGEEGSHQLDAYDWFLERQPVAVTGQGAIRLHRDGREVADTVRVVYTYEDGRELVWDATLGNSYGGRQEHFIGTMGTIKMAGDFGWLFKEADAPVQGWEVYASRQQFHTDQGITLIADATKLAAQGKLKEGIGLPDPPLKYAIDDFLRSVTEDQPLVTGTRDGLRVAAVALAGETAIRTGSRVEIDPKSWALG